MKCMRISLCDFCVLNLFERMINDFMAFSCRHTRVLFLLVVVFFFIMPKKNDLSFKLGGIMMLIMMMISSSEV